MSQYDTEIRQAKDADRLLNDPVFQLAFNRIESGLIERMRAVPMGDIDTQHELILTLQLLGSLKNQFKTAVDSGKMAEISKAQELAQRAKKLWRGS